MPQWDKLDDRNKNIANEPWCLYWSESKSGTPEFEEFLHSPLTVLTQDIDEIDETWTIHTNILNHEIGLSNNPVCSVLMTDSTKKLAYLTFYKHPVTT